MWMCLVSLPLEYLSIFFISMALWLSWNIIFRITVYPWAYKNYMFQRIPDMRLSSMTILSFVEILVFILYLLKSALNGSLPQRHCFARMDIHVGYIPYAVLIHNIITLALLASSARIISTVSLMYITPYTNQKILWSSKLGGFILVVRNAMAVLRLGH